MGYYSDLFMRPKQAMQTMADYPSLFRAILFVVSSTLVGVVATLLFVGTIFWDTALEFLVVDAFRWILGGIVLVLLGMILSKIPLNMGSFTKGLAMLSHVNFYGFFMFVVGTLLLPVVTIPGVLESMQQANAGIIGPEELNEAVLMGLSSNLVNPLSILFFLLSLLFLLYAIYGMYLAVNQYLKTTVFKSVLVMIILVLFQSFLLFSLFG
jgi:hypothetical protein